MNPEYLSLLFEYNDWADRRIARAAEPLIPEEWTAPGPSGYPSLHQTFLHLMASEWMWLQRLHGVSPSAAPSPENFPVLADLRPVWEEQDRELREFVAAQSPEDLQRILRYRDTRGQEWAQPLWQVLMHLGNHGTQHRSEAALILTGFGRSPGNMDLVAYLREQQR